MREDSHNIPYILSMWDQAEFSLPTVQSAVLVSTAGEPTLSLLYVKEIMTSADH
jgi:hypothetical protein